MKYKFKIIETLSKIVEVEADDSDLAYEKVEEMINCEESCSRLTILKAGRFIQ